MTTVNGNPAPDWLGKAIARGLDNQEGGGATPQGQESQAPRPTTDHSRDAGCYASDSSPSLCGQVEMPAGFDLFTELVEYFLQSAPKPNRGVAIGAAYTFLATIFARVIQTPTHASCNILTLLFAVTGGGKEWASGGIVYLINTIAEMPGGVPGAKSLIGKKIVSGPGFVKEVVKNPSAFWRVNEAANLLAGFGDKRAPMHLKQLGDTILDVSSKGGAEGVLDPYAYSDTDKVGEPVYRPNPTILFEGTPEGILPTLTLESIANGFWPRLSPFMGDSKREYYNEARRLTPSPMLAQTLANIIGICLTLNRNNQAVVVQWDDDAREAMRGFDREVTDRMNANGSEAENELWNRAHLKALKYASIHAAARNVNFPQMNLADAHKGIELARSQVELLLAKVRAGETGEQAGNQNRQHNEIKRVIREYFEADHSKYAKLQPLWEMHQRGIVTAAYIQRRLITLKAFTEDRVGATNAINNAIKQFIEQDELREIPKAQLSKEYGHSPRSFCLVRPKEFFGINNIGGI